MCFHKTRCRDVQSKREKTFQRDRNLKAKTEKIMKLLNEIAK
jgi:hypothetical protein